jgi:tRNA-dependent cyclodipeptide synthase
VSPAQLGQNQDIERTVTRRYRAEVHFVSPPTARKSFEEHDTCFLGVSLENQNFTPPKFKALVIWVSRRFANCAVLVGDGIHRITLEMARSMSPATASIEAVQLGDEFIKENSAVLNEFREQTDFWFLKCSDVQRSAAYADYHRRLRGYFEDNEEFRESVYEFGRNYHRNRSDGLAEAELRFRIGRSCDYFLEEFAIFCCLKERGLPVMVYPGSFSTLREVACGIHPGVPAELRDLIVVSLDLKGR